MDIVNTITIGELIVGFGTLLLAGSAYESYKQARNLSKANYEMVTATQKSIELSEKSFRYQMKPKIAVTMVSAGVWEGKYPATLDINVMNYGTGIATGVQFEVTNQAIKYIRQAKSQILMASGDSCRYTLISENQLSASSNPQEVQPCLLRVLYKDELGVAYESMVDINFNYEKQTGIKNVDLVNNALVGVQVVSNNSILVHR